MKAHERFLLTIEGSPYVHMIHGGRVPCEADLAKVRGRYPKPSLPMPYEPSKITCQKCRAYTAKRRARPAGRT